MRVHVSPFRIVESEVGQRHPDRFFPFLFFLHQREASLRLNAAVMQPGAEDAFLACVVCVWACSARCVCVYICFEVAAEVKGSVTWTFIYPVLVGTRFGRKARSDGFRLTLTHGHTKTRTIPGGPSSGGSRPS